MVYCSHCGIQNRDGSKFCNNCGARLASEPGLRCPMCSTLNQVETVFCSNCGARLVPLVASPPAEPKAPPAPIAPPIKGLSLPAKAVSSTNEADTQPETPIEPAAQLENEIEPGSKLPVAEETASIEEGEIPDWITRLRSVAPADSVQDDGIVVEEIPDWLKPASPAITQAVSEQTLSETPTPAVQKIQVPDWLSRVSPPTVETTQTEQPVVEPSVAKPEPVEDELPDWLRQTPSDLTAPNPPAVAEKELPDWLRPGLSAEEKTPTTPSELEPIVQDMPAEPEFIEPVIAESPQVPTISEPAIALETTGAKTMSEVDELPDWLRDAVAVESQEPLPTPPPALTSEPPLEAPLPGEIPSWVAALKPKDADAIAPSFPGEKSPEPIESGELPPWLADIQPKETELLNPATPAQPSAETTAPSELPAWVMALKPKEADQPIAAPAEPTQEEFGNLPDWVLALKPTDAPTASPILESALASSQGAAILSDLQGVLPLAASITQPHPKPQRLVPAERSEGARVFESLLASTAEPAVIETKPTRRRSLRPLIYVLLLLAVLVPFIVPMDSTVRITQVPAEGLFNLINALPANAPVIVSFDYDPGTAGEMDLPAKAIVRHLIQRGAKILVVSTLDTGPQMAQHIMSAIEQENPKIKYGSDYVIAYLPSHEVSLAQLASGTLPTQDYKNNSIEAFLASANLRTLRTTALIIEIAGRDDRLKIWMEQVQPRAGVKIAAAVSAAVEPKARAYLGANQLAAMTSGLLGAAQYEALTRQPGQALIAVNSQSIAQIVLIFIIVLGNLSQLISRARGQAA